MLQLDFRLQFLYLHDEQLHNKYALMAELAYATGLNPVIV